MNKYYSKVPADQVQQLMRFRQEHPLMHLDVNGISWEYLFAGQSDGKPLLLLPGALSTAESAWRTINLLSQGNYRLICPGYPPEVGSMGELADGIAAILEHEGIHSAYVVGGSYGGMLAQVFTRRHPNLVEKLVLSHTYPPENKRAIAVEPALRLVKLLPLGILKRMLRSRMTGILPVNPSPGLLLVAAQIHETVDTRLTRQAALNTYRRMMDFDRMKFTSSDLANWQGKTLIILAEDDPTTPESLRKALVALYPGAKLRLFKGSGHATSILESDVYIKVMEEFLEEQG